MKYFEKFIEFSHRRPEEAEDQQIYLCHEFKDDKYFQFLFKPTTDKEIEQHVRDGYARYAWGESLSDADGKFTPLRQNIVLFMAAMNNEL